MHTKPPITRFANGERVSGGSVIATVRRFMNRFLQPKIPIGLLLVLTTVVATAISIPRSSYLHDRDVVASIGPAVVFAHVDEPVISISGPPHAIGFYRWHGPSILESPMRSLAIPWFDRIERVSIFVDKKLTVKTLAAIPKLGELQSIEIENPTLNVDLYRNAIGASGRTVTLLVTEY